ncbi:MAG: polysaccharide deacetylase family protein [Dysosmobacter sp.]
MKRILPLLVLCLLLTGCVALPATAPAEPMYLALTFDDGPSPQYTPRLLDGLKQRGVHATFFLIGQQVQDYPELVADASGRRDIRSATTPMTMRRWTACPAVRPWRT